ncbi:hypothetical protein BDA99DRAFT_544247 [Phascolomyces articulosus]|uniref:F-box domain-containing protein n=1 Tax=Phascolomyces articulosus TaxID=60185 RepID=A0AAD5P7F5_9FUNG|nr:hypothetical protein BDA99DRAFT_544247 [Phascolomyces articulosus]
MMEIFDRLPFEINSQIFSSMNQHDCLEMLRVCKEWYNKAPFYMTDVWKNVNFSKGVAVKKNACLLQCLGPHVQSVHVSYEEEEKLKTDVIFDELKKRDCTFTKLIIQSEGCRIEMLPKKTEYLFSTLTSFGEHLVQLILRDTHDISLFEIARTCPQLMFLSIRLAENTKMVIKEEEMDHSKERTLLPDLICLTLDIKFEFFTRIEPLLHHCPNLRVLRLASIFHYEPPTTFRINQTRTSNHNKSLDVESILNLCPHLYRLDYGCKIEINDLDELDFVGARSSTIINKTLTPKQQQEQQYQMIKEQLPSSFEQFIYYDDFSDPNPHQLIPFLKRTRNTLSTLQIFHNNRFQRDNLFWQALATVTLPHIEELSYSVAMPTISDPTPFMSLLTYYANNPTSKLQKLSLCIWPQWMTKTLLISLSQIRTLTSLSLYAYTGSMGTTRNNYKEEDVLRLESLEGALEHIELAGDIVLSAAMFQTVATLTSSLRTIVIRPSTFEQREGGNFFQRSDMRPEGGLLNMVHAMGRPHCTVQSLELEYLSHLDDTMMKALGNAKSLTSLKISGSKKLTGSGLRSFANKKAGNTRFRLLAVDSACVGVSYDDIQYAKNKLGKNTVSSNIRMKYL